MSVPSLRAAFAVVAALACVAAPARSQDTAAPCAPPGAEPAAFGANDNHPGVIDLYFFGAGGATVAYYECIGSRAVLLGARADVRDGYTPMYAATTWSCTRRSRLFAASAKLADGSVQRGLTDIRTPSCAQRFAIDAPARSGLGARDRVLVRDRWGIGGVTARWCLAAPRSRATCRPLRFVVGQRVARRAFVANRLGRWRLALRVGGYTTAIQTAVGVRAARPRHLPRVLATGDSTMQGVDVALADELAGAATVISDVHPGAGLSYGDGWLPVARRQTARHAALIVLSIGADEGWPMTDRWGVGHDCCDAGWTQEYTRRMRAVLAAYRRHARVVVLTVVAPRDPDRARIVAASTGATLRAAGAMRGVRVLRVDQRFTPHGYQATIRFRGRDVAVREPDGVHLNVAGTTIEARQAAPIIRAALGRTAGRRGALR